MSQTISRAPTTTHKPIEDVLGYITTEMRVNSGSSIVRTIRENLGSIDPRRLYDAYHQWYIQVRNGGPWDHKRPINARYGRWSYDSGSGMLYSADIWSNLHYGFVGNQAGFSDWMLTSAAGYAQLRAGTSPKDGYWERRSERIGDGDFLSAFDDPSDRAAIEIGIALSRAKGTRFTDADVLAAVRADSRLTRQRA